MTTFEQMLTEKVAMYISMFSEDNMAMYKTAHAEEHHVFTDEKGMVRELHRVRKMLKEDEIVVAGQFLTRGDMAKAIKTILIAKQKEIVNYLLKPGCNTLQLTMSFPSPVSYTIGWNTDFSVKHPVSNVDLILAPSHDTAFKVVTCYPYPGFEEMDEWYDAMDQWMSAHEP